MKFKVALDILSEGQWFSQNKKHLAWFLFFFFLTMSNKCLILRISVRKLASYRIWNLQCIITNYRIWNSISNWWRLCVLEDFNLNLLFKVKYILERPNEAGKFYKELLPGNRKFTELCSTYLVYGPSRATCNTSALINSVLPNTEEHFSQSGIIDIAISDHSIIHRARKTPKAWYRNTKK